MKRIIILSLSLVVILSSCLKDKGSVSMTYNKASAVYGDIEEIRDTDIKGQLREIDNPGKIFVGENFILIGEEDEGIHVYDNSNPSNPINISFIEIPYNKEFNVKGNFLYAESHYDLLKIDLTSPGAPVLQHRLENAFGEPIINDNQEVLLGFTFKVSTDQFELNSPEAEALEQTSILFYNHKNQLIPYSSIPSSFAGSGTTKKGTLSKMAIDNNHIYVVTNEKLYVYSDGSVLNSVNEIQVGFDIETIFPNENKLYIGTRNSMIVYDASSPSSPEHLGTYNHPTSCDPVYPKGGLAYLTLRTADFSGCNGDENSLVVLDIINPSNPEEINTIPMDSPYGLTMANNKLFVGEGENGLTVFDATNPEEPILLTEFDQVLVYDVIPHPTNPSVIMTTGDFGLELYEFNDSDNSLTKLGDIQY